MRLHIELEAALIAEIDEIAGHRQRSAFVPDAMTPGLSGISSG